MGCPEEKACRQLDSVQPLTELFSILNALKTGGFEVRTRLSVTPYI